MVGQKKLFEKFLNAESLFVNKEALKEHFLPDHLPHRDRETEEIAQIVAPCLRQQRPSNALIHGYPGTGKTAVTRFVLENLRSEARRLRVPLQALYVNCNMKGVTDTEYRVIREFITAMGGAEPQNGLSKTQLYDQFFALLEKRQLQAILVFDEIDKLMQKSGTQFLYTLTRVDLQNAELSFMGITNDITLMDNLDGRIRSSLSQQRVIFSPYDGKQLADILAQRVRLAFRPGVVIPGTISKCASLGAQEHGDARRSLQLLRVAGHIAEWQGASRVSLAHVDQAGRKINHDSTLKVVRGQPKQHAAVLHCILSLWTARRQNEPIRTGAVYNEYVDVARRATLPRLSAQRVSEIITELDTVGLIDSHLVSRGRGGRSQEVSVLLPGVVRKKVEEATTDILRL